jgi:hypothetical protein
LVGICSNHAQIPTKSCARRGREHPYARVVGRLGSFFGDPRREIDVVSLHIFGYGRAA